MESTILFIRDQQSQIGLLFVLQASDRKRCRPGLRDRYCPRVVYWCPSSFCTYPRCKWKRKWRHDSEFTSVAVRSSCVYANAFPRIPSNRCDRGTILHFFVWDIKRFRKKLRQRVFSWYVACNSPWFYKGEKNCQWKKLQFSPRK